MGDPLFTREEILDMRIELSDMILALNKDGKELFEFQSSENDFVVLSDIPDTFHVKNMSKAKFRIDQMGVDEMVSAMSVITEWFREEEEEIKIYAEN